MCLYLWINISMADNQHVITGLFTDISVNVVYIKAYIKAHYNVNIDYIGQPSVWLASVWMIFSMWLLMYEQESSCLSGNQYVINLFFIIIIVFSSLKNYYYCSFLVLK